MIESIRVWNLCSSLLHFRCLRSFFVSVHIAKRGDARLVEKSGANQDPQRKLCSIKQTIRSDDQINPFELADLTKSIGRAGWEGVISGEKNR